MRGFGNWKKRCDLPNPEVPFLEEVVSGCKMEALGFEIWNSAEHEVSLRVGGVTAILTRSGVEQGEARLQLGHGSFSSAL